MVEVHFTSHLERFVDCPSLSVEGRTVADVLDRVFDSQPRLKSYLLDDQDRLRQHVAIFVDGAMVRDRKRLTDPVAPTSRIDVMQALSGG